MRNKAVGTSDLEKKKKRWVRMQNPLSYQLPSNIGTLKSNSAYLFCKNFWHLCNGGVLSPIRTIITVLGEGEDMHHQVTRLSFFCLKVKSGLLLGQTAENEKNQQKKKK